MPANGSGDSFAMTELITHFPGQELPVSEVGNRLRQMWDNDGEESPSHFRASQMNIVLHFGFQITPEEALAAFNSLLLFVQRYPGRIIVLCPNEAQRDGSMSAKLFSQCYIGPSQREMCCCEALMLSFEPDDCGYLSNQVSVWLESDLPTYHWFMGVPEIRIRKYFDNLLKGVRRMVYDSSREESDIADLDWPRPEGVRDLAQARLLPIRQSLGQFFSGFPMELIQDGLQAISLNYAAGKRGEAKRLAEWIKSCLSLDLVVETLPIEPREPASDQENPLILDMVWTYQNDYYFKWEFYQEGDRARFDYKLGSESKAFMTQLKPLAPEQALAEALFF
ncbi:MAG: Uncharacterised protein [Opitutia bacterium UBA7350]|nr:MAG: Uncharacterised protein [Opitutae bacterium UBA7350]